MYQYACSLVNSLSGVETSDQQFFSETFLEYMLLVFLVLFVSGAFFYSYITKKIMEPIRDLAASTEELTQGRFPEKLDVQQTRDELFILAQNFNRLSLQLKETEDARSKMVSDMAHEFRTPLSNINGYLEGLKKGVIPPDPSIFESLHQESARLTDMVNNLYQLSEWNMQSPVLKKETVPVDELLHNAASLFEWQMADKNMKLHLDIEPCQIQADAGSIRQMVSNLLQNAVEHRKNEDPVYLHGFRKGTVYVVEVQNTGAWIEPETKHRLFERFHREDSSRQRQTGGSGLGLAIVKELAEQHNGGAGIETDGWNHHFWFSFPL
ncbi:two-component system, OmpR family, sensor histidine kinase BaeS [Salibacterium halotolerans]|uniref:histidine kinase n=1 Tax=Salibacterium halotolerans TaxID=1884432 RepID=A0A1I5YCL9_9BACI|nr:two-component system, OmpR family, sensor histidine kinase BaeS [Salibacterium halotolerans]